MTQILRVASLLAVACVPWGSALAQQDYFSRNKYEAVATRAQPDYDPVSKRAGSFDVRPEAELGVRTVSNAFAASDNEESDVIIRLGASVRADSDWSRHRLSLTASTYRDEYLDNSETSNSTTLVAAEGRIDATREAWLTPRLSYGWLTENRQDFVDSFGTRNPIEYEQLDAGIDLHYQTGRFQAVAGVSALKDDFADVGVLGAATEIDQDYRDRTLTRAQGRLAYAVSPDVALFGQAVIYEADYDTDIVLDAAPRNRDSEGYILNAGADFELQSLVRGQVAVGYFSDEKKDDYFTDVDGLSVDGRVTWFPTQLTNVTLTARRGVVDLGLRQSASAVQTAFGAQIDHELRRNILLRLSGRVLNEAYDDIDREDEVTEWAISTTYKLNRHAHLDGFVRYASRDISGTAAFTGRTYDNTTIGVSLRMFP